MNERAVTGMLADRLANGVIIFVTSLWGLNVIASVFQFNGYQSDPYIHGAFMGTVGLAFYAKYRGNTPRDNNDGEKT